MRYFFKPENLPDKEGCLSVLFGNSFSILFNISLAVFLSILFKSLSTELLKDIL